MQCKTCIILNKTVGVDVNIDPKITNKKADNLLPNYLLL